MSTGMRALCVRARAGSQRTEHVGQLGCRRVQDAASRIARVKLYTCAHTHAAHTCAHNQHMMGTSGCVPPARCVRTHRSSKKSGFELSYKSLVSYISLGSKMPLAGTARAMP
jgi:hypothetical protein